MAISDTDIKSRIIDEIIWDTRIDPSDVHVAVDNGCVQLTGTVRSLLDRSRVAEDACQVEGVISVDDQLTIRPTTKVSRPSDDEVKQTVENLLSVDVDLGTSDIRVSVDDGVVTLDGSVESFWKKRLADWMVCRARGVTDLVNRIAVVPTERIVDKSIAEAVRAAIERNANVSIDDVTITVEDRVVTLSGTVPTWAAREAARNAAALSRGVVDVIDDLGLRSPDAIGSACELEQG